MELETFIESGTIELFVLGIANKKEQEEVRKMAAKYTAIAERLQLQQRAIEKYILAYELEAPVKIKNSIFEKINMEKETNEIQLTPVSPVKTWWVAASLIISTISLLANVYLGNQTINLKQQLAQVQIGNKRLVFENLINKANYRSAAEQLSLLHKHGNKTTHLEGLELAKESSAMIYWNSETKDLYINIDHLPPVPEGKQYQLWALLDGKPIDAGVIELNAVDNTIYKMKGIENAQSFAISLENVGGAASPNMKAIYAMGNI